MRFPTSISASLLLAVLATSRPSLTFAQQPASRPLTPSEFNALQSTEVQIEYETIEDYAESQNLTVDELDARARAFWDDATLFEYRRALDSSREAFPYLICRQSIGGGGGGDDVADDSSGGEGDGDGPIISGYAHRRAIDEAIAAASINSELNEGVFIPPGSTISLDPSSTLINSDGAYCAFARLGGTVALGLDCGDAEIDVECIVQPVLVAMKLMPDTVQDIVEAVEEFYERLQAAGGDDEEEDEPFATLIPDDEGGTVMTPMTAAATDTADGEGENAASIGGGPTPFPEPEPTFPSLDIILCPGVVDDDAIAEYAAGNGGGTVVVDLQDVATSWLLDSTGQEDGTKPPASQSFYWTSDSAASLLAEYGYAQPERAAFLADILDQAIGTDLCDATYTNRLSWTGVFLPRIQGVHLEFIDADAEEVDQACALALTIALATLPQVCALEVTPTRVPFNDRAQWLIQSFETDERPFFDAGIRGEGQVVALSDTGVDVNSCYFSDPDAPRPGIVPNANHRKIVQYWDFVDDSDYKFGHGTHVAGTVLGKKADGTGIADGIAPDAKLAFCDIGTPRGFLRIPPNDLLLDTGRVKGMANKARIHSASWGAEMNFYDYQSRAFDDILFMNDDLLTVVAAGNSGRFNELNTVGAPAVAKNILSVGASQSANDGKTSGVTPRQGGPEYVADFSSRGTTADGRMKPDVVAPGEMILSAGARPDLLGGACDDLGVPLLGFSRGGLVWMAGTSMATPAVSGTAALVREYFEKGYYPGGTKASGPEIMPSAALVKAVLMNGAQFMSGVDNPTLLDIDSTSNPYDDAQGMGRVSLIDSLFLEDNDNVRVKVWDREVILNGNLQTFDVTIDTTNCYSSELRATLVWSEPGSTIGCRRCLLNDLDLFVIPESDPATVYYPNGLRKRDSTNNAERVIISDALDGETFKIFVEAHNLLDAKQAYSLVVTGCFATADKPQVLPVDGGEIVTPIDSDDGGILPEGGLFPDRDSMSLPGDEAEEEPEEEEPEEEPEDTTSSGVKATMATYTCTIVGTAMLGTAMLTCIDANAWFYPLVSYFCSYT